MINKIIASPYVQNGTVVNWFQAFHSWLHTTSHVDIRYLLGADGYPYSNYAFNVLLHKFITESRIGQAYSPYIKFSNTTPPVLQGTYISFRHTYQIDSKHEIKAMEGVRQITDSMGFQRGNCFPYAMQYLTYETNKILQQELYRNLMLAGVCVFLVTLLLIANLQTSVVVFTCVIFTLIDVAGTLYFWGVTVDTASSILLTLSVGLAVDYSAHIGHTYMTVLGSKNERSIKALAAIGPAVFSGGFSTFLAFVLLSRSNSYGFALFFRVFITVVIFGLFHGLAYLPVILSWIGPDPYHVGEHDEKYLPSEIDINDKEDFEMDADSGCTSAEQSPFKSQNNAIKLTNGSDINKDITCVNNSVVKLNRVHTDVTVIQDNQGISEFNKMEPLLSSGTDNQMHNQGKDS